MGKKWVDLQCETLSKVFELVDGLAQLMECQLTCKEWSSAAQELIYKEVELRDLVIAEKFFLQRFPLLLAFLVHM